MSIVIKTFNHNSSEMPGWSLATCPTAKMPGAAMWKGDRCIAIPGTVGPVLSEIWVYREWEALSQTELTLEPHDPGDALPFSPHPDVSAEKLLSIIADGLGLKPVRQDDSSTAMQKIHAEGFVLGRRVWCKFWIGLGSSLVQFEGKIERSDPSDPESLLSERDIVRVLFASDDVRAYFNESGLMELAYASPIPDGRSFPFSGLAAFGDADDLPTPDGSIDSLLFLDGKPAWDGHIPPGMALKEVTGSLYHGWNSTVLPAFMNPHPIAGHPYSHTTGGWYSFGFPGTEACFDPKLIAPLRNAIATECFRPVHRVELDGKPFKRVQHEGNTLFHNMMWNYGPYTFGKANPHDDGVEIGDWGTQDGEHLGMHTSMVYACLKNSPIAIDNIERCAELQLGGKLFLRIPRHTYRDIKFFAECSAAPISESYRSQCRQKAIERVGDALDYMDSPQALRPDRPNAPFNTVERDGDLWWDVFQNGLVGSIPKVLEMAGIPIGDSRFEPHFTSVVRATLHDGLFVTPLGFWRAHWSVRRDNLERKPANSHRAIIRQCAPGLIWLRDRASAAGQERIDSILASVNDGSSDAIRFLIG